MKSSRKINSNVLVMTFSLGDLHSNSVIFILHARKRKYRNTIEWPSFFLDLLNKKRIKHYVVFTFLIHLFFYDSLFSLKISRTEFFALFKLHTRIQELKKKNFVLKFRSKLMMTVYPEIQYPLLLI